jgi:hypothetical protein
MIAVLAPKVKSEDLDEVQESLPEFKVCWSLALILQSLLMQYTFMGTTLLPLLQPPHGGKSRTSAWNKVTYAPPPILGGWGVQICWFDFNKLLS